MKINVLTIDDVRFGALRWWSAWIDVCVFDYNCTPYLLQMRISRTNKKAFRCVRITGSIVYRQATCGAIGDLTQMPRGDV